MTRMEDRFEIGDRVTNPSGRTGTVVAQASPTEQGNQAVMVRFDDGKIATKVATMYLSNDAY